MTGLCLIVLGVICGGIGISRHLAEQNAGKLYEELKEQVQIMPDSGAQKDAANADAQNTQANKDAQRDKDIQGDRDAQGSASAQKDAQEGNTSPNSTGADPDNTLAAATAEAEEIPIDFESLTAQYPDIYAWIRIPGTVIDYPIVQREGDNTYYLNHTIDGKKKTEGAIFTEDYNSKDFEDPNTLIYGHNMKNDSMFGELHNYKDRKFLEENPEIIIYLPDRILRYQIFAAYVYDNRHILLNFDFEDTDVYSGYLDSIFKRKGMSSNIDSSVTVTTEDKIITLSTCNGNDTQRYLVQAVLISK